MAAAPGVASGGDGDRSPPPPLVLVGYLSAPRNRAKRDWLRESLSAERARRVPELRGGSPESRRNAGGGDGDGRAWGGRVPRPILRGAAQRPGEAAAGRQGDRSAQGALATPMEIDLALQLQNESDALGDIQMIPMRDTYNDLPLETLSILQHGARSGARLIFKIDDDQCPTDMARVLKLAAATSPNMAQYAGRYKFNGTEYTTMRGADGTTSDYMGGLAYLVSGALARAIALDDSTRSILHMPYGSSSEDVDIRRWYLQAQMTHPELTFEMDVIPTLTSESLPPEKHPLNNGTVIIKNYETYDDDDGWNMYMVYNMTKRRCADRHNNK